MAGADQAWLTRAATRGERLSFLVETLRLVAALVRSRLSGIVTVAALLAAAQVAFLGLWAAAAARTLAAPGGALDAAGVLAALALAVSYRWTTGIIKHALTHVVAVQVTYALKETAERGARVSGRTRSRL